MPRDCCRDGFEPLNRRGIGWLSAFSAVEHSNDLVETPLNLFDPLMNAPLNGVEALAEESEFALQEPWRHWR